MMDHLDARLDDQSTDVTTLSQRAAAQLYKEQYDLAKADWLQVVQLDPKRLRQAFDAFRRAEQWSTAAEFGYRYHEQRPDYSYLWLQLASVAVISGDEERYTQLCESILNQPTPTVKAHGG